MVEINEKFYLLEEEKQLRIINSALEVFSKNDYKKAVTEEIALKANISKGLLFHYFKNKKTLYFFLYEYTIKLMSDSINNSDLSQITDFFEIMDCGAKLKLKMIKKNPYIVDFCIKYFYSENEVLGLEIQEKLKKQIENSYTDYFSNMDFYKFRDDINILDIYKMFLWMTDGYLHEKRMQDKNINIDEMMDDFNKWKEIFRKVVYKEEYL